MKGSAIQIQRTSSLLQGEKWILENCKPDFDSNTSTGSVTKEVTSKSQVSNEGGKAKSVPVETIPPQLEPDENNTNNVKDNKCSDCLIDNKEEPPHKKIKLETEESSLQNGQVCESKCVKDKQTIGNCDSADSPQVQQKITSVKEIAPDPDKEINDENVLNNNKTSVTSTDNRSPQKKLKTN